MLHLWALLLLAELTVSAPSVALEPPATAPAPVLAPTQAKLLAAWFKKVGSRHDDERFGDLLMRAAKEQLGRKYYDAPQSAGPEVLRVELGTFQCVSLVESSLAVARCVWSNEPTSDCFLREVAASRYRGGNMRGYASRLHYFTDWLEDNARRGRLKVLGAEVGAKPVPQVFSFMTQHPQHYPALADPAAFKEIGSIEAGLSAEPHLVIDRADIGAAQRQLQNGDIVGLVSDKEPGMVIIHAALVYVGKDGTRQLMHAGVWHKRVLIAASDVANYVTRRPERLGLMAARPLPP